MHASSSSPITLPSSLRKSLLCFNLTFVRRTSGHCLETFREINIYLLRNNNNWWGGQREIGNWGDPDVDGRIILRWIFRKLEGVVGLDGIGSG
jgi:hypothetical protein